jgi:colanic acid/amylovoran biosynthesis glycosyltransferase
MIKVGIVLSQPPGYSETFFNSKIEGLQKNGFKVTLFCQNNDTGFKTCQVKRFSKTTSNPILQLLYFFKVYMGLLPHLKKVMNWYLLESKHGVSKWSFLKKVYINAPILKADLDWLHFGFGTLALERESIAKVIGAKMAVSFRGFDINVYPKKNPDCYHLVWKHVTKVHSISNYLLEEARCLGLHKTTPYSIITPAVNLNHLPKHTKTDKNSKLLKIVTVARLHWMKGIDNLIETASFLQASQVDFEWLVIGGGSTQEEERYLYHIYEKGLTNNVKLLGKRSHQETLEILYDAGVYIQTSLNEGFCNAVLEAQALGKLCVAFNTGGLPENIIDQKTGWLVENVNSEKLAKKIIEIIEMPRKEKKIITSFAKNRVAEQFNIEKQQQEFVEFYKN